MMLRNEKQGTGRLKNRRHLLIIQAIYIDDPIFQYACPSGSKGASYMRSANGGLVWCFNTVVRGLRNDIHPLQPEVWRGGEEVSVIGVDFSEAMLGGAGEVKSVGGAEVGGGWGGGEGLGDAVHDGARQ